jgi:hypothetical protein
MQVAPAVSQPRFSSAVTTELRRALIDCEEDRTLRAVLVGMLREANRAVRSFRTGWLPGLRASKTC